MNKTRDLRVQKTFDALIDAFQALLSEKTFEEITIKELCSRARIRPATFYTHFKDKYDFFAFLVKELRSRYIEQADSSVHNSSPEEYFTQLIKHGLDFIEKNESFLKALDSNSMLTLILHSATEDLNKDLEFHLEEMKKNGAALFAEPALLTQIMIGSLTQCARWWIENHKYISKDEMMLQLSDVMKKFVQFSPL